MRAGATKSVCRGLASGSWVGEQREASRDSVVSQQAGKSLSLEIRIVAFVESKGSD